MDKTKMTHAEVRLIEVLTDKPRCAADLPMNLRRMLRPMEGRGLLRYNSLTNQWHPVTK